jgi:superfamily II DNA or RNA helicase
MNSGELPSKSDSVSKLKDPQLIIPKAGQMVHVRNRPGVVRDVIPFSSSAGESTHAVSVEYFDGWLHPAAEEVIWEREVGARIVSNLAIPRISEHAHEPDAPERLAAFLDSYRWSAVNHLGAKAETAEDVRLVAPWHSAIQVEDYQIYPVLKSLLMPRVTLLLADDVGLGKTIEAGLIVSELFARRRIRRVLIVCPASLQRQWRDELREKFYLDFVVVDRDETFRMQRTLGVDSNPWSTYPRIITSMDYLRQRDVLESFRAATEGIAKQNGAALPWQMLIVDEAHNLFPSRFGDETDRYMMLREISPRFEHKLFLTATPHNGYTVSFTGLLELLDPVRFRQTAIMEAQDHEQVQLAMVRRLKSELDPPGGPSRFPKRHVEGLPVSLAAEEKRLFEALREYRRTALELLAKVGNRERRIGDFLMTLLAKRLLSSSYAFACTWWQHVEGVDIGKVGEDVIEHAVARAETPVNDDEEKGLREADVARQGGAWLSAFSRELRSTMDDVGDCLDKLGWDATVIKAGFSATKREPADARWDILSRWIDQRLKLHGHLRKDERLIVFTEYKHTLDYLVRRFRRVGLESPQLQTLYSDVKGTAREQIKEAFNDPESPLRILLATDIASEGINLQTSCRYIFHQEIPWNPMRLEQRNGRVDRHGQSREVHVFHFSSEDESDLRFLAHVVKKVEQAREDLGSVGQVLDRAILEHFTTREVAESEMDQRVDAVLRDDVDSNDVVSRDKGTTDLYAKTLQRLRATELRLGLSPEGLARLLSVGMQTEGGLIEPLDEKGVYRIRVIPPVWKQLVKETIQITSGKLQGSLPRIVFDPAYFESVENGRKIYRVRSDTALVRLGHPLMRRALWALRRQLWEPTGLTRWTVQSARLPAGIDQVLLLHLMLEVSNQLREVAHQEVLAVTFQVSGDHLTPVVDELWREMEHLERSPLPGPSLDSWSSLIADHWPAHESFILDYAKSRRTTAEREFQQIMASSLKSELEREKDRFSSRIREIQNRPKWLQKQLAEVERQHHRLEQGFLMPEYRAYEEQRLRDLEWQIAGSHFEQMKGIVERERDRMLNSVLPKRFALGSIDLQPLAVEYIVSAGRSTR